MSIALSPAETSKVIALLGMLSSDFDGERATAGMLVSRLLKSKGVTWADLIRPEVCYAGPQKPPPAQAWQPPQQDWQRVLRDCMKYAVFLSLWEREFCGSISGRVALTIKQQNSLDRIAAKLITKGFEI